jgi:tRNA G18 (ribose-2'-O)-methylase SpoU
VEAAGGTFVVEGVTAIRRALTSDYPVRSILITPGKAAELGPDLAGFDIEVFVADQEVMNTVTGFNIHRGAVAIAGRCPLATPSAVLREAHTVAVLEGLNDHENLGAVARAASALGIDGLLLDPTCADPLYRRCVRVSMGEILHLPLARVAPWPDGLSAVRDAGFVLVALTPVAAAEPIEVVARTVSGRRVAVMLGAEGHGLSSGALAAADLLARIVMRPGADSLNVGHAAAIGFHRLASGPQ